MNDLSINNATIVPVTDQNGKVVGYQDKINQQSVLISREKLQKSEYSEREPFAKTTSGNNWSAKTLAGALFSFGFGCGGGTPGLEDVEIEVLEDDSHLEEPLDALEDDVPGEDISREDVQEDEVADGSDSFEEEALDVVGEDIAAEDVISEDIIREDVSVEDVSPEDVLTEDLVEEEGPGVCTNPPNSFNLTAPTNGDTSASVTPTLDWQNATDPDAGDIISYTLMVDDDSSFATPITKIGLTSSNYAILPSEALAYGTTYYWTAGATDNCDQTTWSDETWNFSTMREACVNPPNAFNLTAPTNGDTSVSVTPTLDWQNATDPDAGDIISYTLMIDDDSSFATPITKTGLTSSNYTILPSEALAYGTTYYWKVGATDTCDQTTWRSWSFTTIREACVNPPHAFNLTTPVNGSTAIPLLPTLDWQDATDPDVGDTVSYTLLIDDDPSFASPITKTGLTSSNYTLAPSEVLVYGATYYWKVGAVDSCGQATWSDEVWNFTARTIGVCSKIDSDVRITNTQYSSISPSLVWTGSEYGVSWADQLSLSCVDIYFKRISGDGVPIGSDAHVKNADSLSEHPSLVWTGSEYGVSWDDSRYYNDEIFFSRISETGVPTGTEVRVTNADSISEYPSLVWTGSEYGVSWDDWRDGGSDYPEIYFNRISGDGVPIVMYGRITNASGTDTNPSLVWRGSEYGLCWYHSGIYFKRISASGSPIGSDIRITDVASTSNYPSLVWANGEYGVSWQDNRDGNNEIYFKRISVSGSPMGSDVRVTNNVSTSNYPSLVWANSENEYGVSWQDNRDGNNEIYFKRISMSGVPIGSDVRITNDGGNSQESSLVWTGSEYGVSWQDNRDGNYEIYFARIGCTP